MVCARELSMYIIYIQSHCTLGAALLLEVLCETEEKRL